jgi:SAM-dependent methyltransferase
MDPAEPPRKAIRDAAYFDQWYADMETSPTRDAIFTRNFGLPPGFQSNSSLTWQGIAELTDALRLPPGGLLLDVACGRGSYGIEVAQRSDVRLIGVDFSAVALDQARLSSARLLPAGRAEFRLGNLIATGLPDGIADGVMCVDAIQFGDPQVAALAEFRRVLAPGARLALTTWEATTTGDPRVSARIQEVNLRRDLPAAGFIDVEVTERPDWREAERQMWEDAMAVPADPGDEGLRSLQSEGRRSLETWDALRRMFATATAP